MTINLCSSSSEVNTINKHISTIASVSAVIKGNISVENPVLLLQYNGSVKGSINYVKIPEFNRSYFIDDIIDLTGGRYEIHCSVDVLESFKSSILALSCVISKQENLDKSNLYLDDGSFVNLNKEFNSVINFPNGFNADGEFILITAGGGGSIG